jgi:hypothetical protein
MSNFVRVRDEHGHEFSINELAVQDAWTVIDEPALDLTGRPRRAIPNTSDTTSAPASTPENHNSDEEL